MPFIKRVDYQIAIRQDHLGQIIPAELDPYLIQAENAGIYEVQSYLRGVFDLTQIFPDIKDFNPNAAYLANTVVWFDDNIYVSLVDVPAAGTNGGNPSNDEDWELNDVRNSRIVQVVVDVIIYHIHKRVSVRDIPIHRKLAYDQALYWLKAVRDGDLSTDLPPLEDEEGEDLRPETITGRPRQEWFY